MGGVWLRSRSEVHGDIHTYLISASNDAVHVQGGAVHNGSMDPRNSAEWPYPGVWDNRVRYLEDIDLQPVLIVTAGQEKTLSHGDRYSKVKVESGGTLKIEPGVIRVGNIQFESGSTITFTNPGRQTDFYADGNMIWRTTISNEDKELVAKGFRLIQLSDKNVNIEGDWAGTIHAARSSLVMGQTNKLMYGRFLAKLVTMHQHSRIYRVDFDPITQSMNLALR
jgi:Zn/Cd-binding protein ZinT